MQRWRDRIQAIILNHSYFMCKIALFTYHSSRLELYPEGSQTRTGDLENSWTGLKWLSSRNLKLGSDTTWLFMILKDVLAPTSVSKPSVGAALNRMTKSLASMILPNLEWSKDPALDTTPHVLYWVLEFLFEFSKFNMDFGRNSSNWCFLKNSLLCKKVWIFTWCQAEQTSCSGDFKGLNFVALRPW